MGKKYNTNIKASYLPNWGLAEGVRELLQNARDAMVEHGATMDVSWVERRREGRKVGTMVIKNDGCTMPLKALLIGHTSKMGDSRTIGQFGEGLKFGMLAILRTGKVLKIRNGSEVWLPMIDRDEEFDEDLLFVQVDSNRKSEDRVMFEIIGIDRVDYEIIRNRCLWLRDSYEHLTIPSGELLTAPEEAGKLYVKGMFVKQTQLRFGVNLRDATLDRDRQMIDDMDYQYRQIIGQALNNADYRDAVIDDIYAGLESGDSAYNIYYHVNDDSRKALCEKFDELYGSGAIACADEKQRVELEHHGIKAAVVQSYGLRMIVENVRGTADAAIKKVKMGASKRYMAGDLSEPNAEILKRAVSMINRACEFEQLKLDDNLYIVDFNDTAQSGTFTTVPGGGFVVRLARSVLDTSVGNVVGILVHELAHRHGEDHHGNHETRMRQLFSNIVDNLTN